MSVTVTFRRLAGKHNKLANMAENIVEDVQDAMLAQVLTAVDIMHSEPPPRIGPKGPSRYVRTHTYATSWREIPPHASGGRLEAGIRGDAVDPYGTNYTEMVGGDSHGEGQLVMHEETGWPLAAEAIDGIVPAGVPLTRAPVRAADRIQKAVHKAIRRS